MAGPYGSRVFEGELKETAQFLLSRKFRKVCLQFPDEELQWSPGVVAALKQAVTSEARAVIPPTHDWHGGKPAGSPDSDINPETRSPGSDINPETRSPTEGSGEAGVPADVVIPEIFVIADAPAGRGCCVDEVSAKHVQADCVVHFGHTCMSRPLSLPARVVLPLPRSDERLDADNCADALSSLPGLIGGGTAGRGSQDSLGGNRTADATKDGPGDLLSSRQDIVVLCTQQFASFMPAVEERLQQKAELGEGNTCRFTFARVRDRNIEPWESPPTPSLENTASPLPHSEVGCTPNGNLTVAGGAVPVPPSPTDKDSSDRREASSKTKAQSPPNDSEEQCRQGAFQWTLRRKGRQLGMGASSETALGPTLGAQDHSQEPAFAWIGPETAALTNLCLVHNSSRVFRIDERTGEVTEHSTQSSRILRRRYYLVEKAKDASIVGIVVAAAGVARARETVLRLRQLVEASGKKAYTISMSRVTPAKLANFPECDVMVLVSCPESVLLDSKEFYAPVITPFEAELAFGEGQQWTGKYTLSLDALSLKGKKDTAASNSSSSQSHSGKLSVDGEDPEPRFSLIQGGYVSDRRQQTQVEVESGDARHSSVIPHPPSTALAVNNATGDVVSNSTGGGQLAAAGGYASTLSASVGSGSEFLTQRREYKGLEVPWYLASDSDQAEGKGWAVQEEKEAGDVVEGRSGRAAVYEGEGIGEGTLSSHQES